VQIDGKHSYEDAIMPVDQFQQRYGRSIACLGGVDINILAAGSPEDVRRRTRWLMESNSIPSYVPSENYLAMLDEAHDVNGV